MHKIRNKNKPGAILKRKNKVGEIHLLKVKTHYTDTVVKTMWY